MRDFHERIAHRAVFLNGNVTMFKDVHVYEDWHTPAQIRLLIGSAAEGLAVKCL